MTLIQTEILRALKAMTGKSKVTESVIAKKVRELNKLDSMKKAGISLLDLEYVLENLNEENIFYSVTITSSNDILLEKSEKPKPASNDSRIRRLKSEKSIQLLTNSSLNKKFSVKNKIPKRQKSESLNIYKDYEE